MSINILTQTLHCPLCGSPCCLVVTVRYVNVPAILATDNESKWWHFDGEQGKRVESRVESVYCSSESCEWTHCWPEGFVT